MFGTGEPPAPAMSTAAVERLHAYREQTDPDDLRRDLEALPGPRNRLHSPEAMAVADEQLLDAFGAAGWHAERRPFALHDVWTSIDYGDFRRPQHHRRLAGTNITATKPGTRAHEAVVVVAHHDTVRDSPGADDNGAGVVALMALARVLASHRHERTVVLAAVDMEELGLVGSRQLVRELSARWRIVDALVYESIGYTTTEPGTQSLPPGFGALYRDQARRVAERDNAGEFTTVLHRHAHPDTAARFAGALTTLEGLHAAIVVPEPTGLPVVGGALALMTPLVTHFARSDHMAFWEVGVPAVWVTNTSEFRNPHYHRPGDVPDLVDYGRVAAIVAATAATIDEVAGRLGAGTA